MSEVTRLRAAIVGTGFAASSHLDALSRLPHVEVAGLLGSTPARGRDGAGRLGVDRSYASMEELLADDVDVVHNCTPNAAHAEITLSALEAGRHVLSEKPLGLDADEAARLAQAAARVPVVAAVSFNYRHYPLVEHLRRSLARPDAGRPHLVHGAYLQDWLLHEDDWNWRLDAIVAGSSRAVADIGSHWFDLVQHVTGERVTSVMAQLGRLHDTRIRPPRDRLTFATADDRAADAPGERVAISTEDVATVLFRLGSDAPGSCTISQVSAGRKNRLAVEIATPSATYAWDQEDPNRLSVGRRDRANEELVRDPSLLVPEAARLAHFPGGHQEGWPDGMRNLMLDVYAAVRARARGEPYDRTFSSFSEATRVQRIVEAVLRSDRDREWVDVPPDPLELVG